LDQPGITKTEQKQQHERYTKNIWKALFNFCLFRYLRLYFSWTIMQENARIHLQGKNQP
jgi:hypothetical protein